MTRSTPLNCELRLKNEDWKLEIGNWKAPETNRHSRAFRDNHFSISNFQFPIFNVSLLFVVLVTLGLTDVAVANQKAKGKARVASESGLRKDVDTFTKTKFSRQAEEAFRAVTTAPDAEADEATLLLSWVQSGNWEEVKAFLKEFEPEAGRRLHTKICSDLSTGNPKSTMLPHDVIALADASPSELEDRQIGPLSHILKLAVKDSDSLELSESPALAPRRGRLRDADHALAIRTIWLRLAGPHPPASARPYDGGEGRLRPVDPSREAIEPTTPCAIRNPSRPTSRGGSRDRSGGLPIRSAKHPPAR